MFYHLIGILSIPLAYIFGCFPLEPRPWTWSFCHGVKSANWSIHAWMVVSQWHVSQDNIILTDGFILLACDKVPQIW